MRRLLLLLPLVVIAGCPSETPKPPPEAAGDGAAVVASALVQLNARLAMVRDYAVEGEVRDKASGAGLRFRYAMQQPGSSVGDLLDAEGNVARSFVFDGKVLAVKDAATKTVTRQDLSASEEQMLLSLHEIFSQFVCEGWRPPLVKPQGTQGRLEAGKLVLEVSVQDEQVALQRLVLNEDGSFVKKEVLDKHGQVLTATTVLEDLVDDATKLKFPKRWSHTEAGSTQEVTLTKWAINAGVDPARFSTAAPEGYEVKQ